MAEHDFCCVPVQKMDLMEKDKWVMTINDELQRMDTIRTAEKQHWGKHSIYKVPMSVKELNAKAYNPQFVSFGPYHNGEVHLRPMEEHKHRALLRFLKKSYKSLESHLNSLDAIAQNLKDSYQSLDPVWEGNSYKFLQTMLLDGCFMIEVLRTTETITDDYVENDPVFSNHGKLHFVPYIRRDMLMLENQLPMLLLTTLLDEETKKDGEFVNKLIVKFFGDTRIPQTHSMGICLHLLDVRRKMLLYPEPPCSQIKEWKSSCWSWISSHIGGRELAVGAAAAGDEMIIRSAVEISEAGINFDKSKSNSLKDISFKGGKLRLPAIMVDDTTKSMFLNLIAFERFHVGVDNTVTSYVFFMDSIIDTAKDVSLLNDEGIIQNAVGSDKAAAQLFNSISKDTTLDQESSLNKVHTRVVVYCKQPLNRWRAYASHTYCANPWVSFSVAAAVFIFILAMLQTVYTILSYHQPK